MSQVQPIKHSITVNASIERVWQALTTPEQMAIWVGAIGFKPAIGAKFEFHAPPTEGWNGITYSEVTVLEEPTRLAFTWSVPNFPATLVTITLRALGDQTEVTLEHTGWDQFPPEIGPVRDQLEQGWRIYVLPNLARLVENSTAA
jgi:uncharacterized protein YndB with AHSA1/START domain